MLAAAVVLLGGCGAGAPTPSQAPREAPFTVAFGEGARFRPPALWRDVAAGRPVRGLRCAAHGSARASAHVELFAHGRGIVVPAGLGVAAPRRREGAYVRGGRCSYPLRTREPTGLVELARGHRTTLGDLFALLGQPLTRSRLGAHRGPVRAWMDGRRWRGRPADLPLRRHAQVVIAAGTQRVPVHATYRFPPGR